MKHYNLKSLSEVKPGFTDLFVIQASDLTDTTNDELQNIVLATLNKGDVVFDHTLIEIVTAADPSPSANATVTASVGRTASGYVDCIAASNVINSGTVITAGVTYAAGAAIGSQVIAADSTSLYCQVDINDADGNLAQITTLEIHIWMSISRRTTDRSGQV